MKRRWKERTSSRWIRKDILGTRVQTAGGTQKSQFWDPWKKWVSKVSILRLSESQNWDFWDPKTCFSQKSQSSQSPIMVQLEMVKVEDHAGFNGNKERASTLQYPWILEKKSQNWDFWDSSSVSQKRVSKVSILRFSKVSILRLWCVFWFSFRLYKS